jgi:hypothetical protein
MAMLCWLYPYIFYWKYLFYSIISWPLQKGHMSFCYHFFVVVAIVCIKNLHQPTRRKFLTNSLILEKRLYKMVHEKWFDGHAPSFSYLYQLEFHYLCRLEFLVGRIKSPFSCMSTMPFRLCMYIWSTWN